ncbi:hypothetical protein GCM10009104_24470 [Marinobacterium maritimum]|uniref:Penicillin-binding protein activator n=2 Tax=Marinobacterium maritimum TaxID=500162 RepID=A0ABN1I7U1_9GAMM
MLKVLLWGLLLLPLGSAAQDSAQVERLRQQINTGGGAPASSALEQLWRELQQLPASHLIELSRREDNNYFEQGWFELARDVRLAPAEQRQSQLNAWRLRWFHHPATAWLPHLQQAVPSLAVPETVQRLGALLPLSGEFAEQGREVLAGMRAALDWDRRQGYRVPQLQVFDSAAVDNLPVFVQSLVGTEGPDLLVGPLRAPLTRQLTSAQPLPVLALNRVGGGTFNGYQLDLASDQELRQLVERIRLDGHRRVLLLAPAGEAWVEPLLAWLEPLSRSQGLVIQARLRYEAVPERLRWQLGQVLGINASRQRGQQLAGLLAEPPEQQVRRRQDIDAVLLIARPEAARLIKPVLNYHHADELPVYAGSHLFSGKVDPVRDRDLEGILFCDMPWRLRKRPGSTPSSSFFALGVDAGSVYRALPEMGAGTPGYFEGETGHLRLLEGWRLQRALPCARFVQGQPQLIKPAE